MRRGFAFLLSVSALGILAPAAFSQYPNPYGPMPMQYAPNPYGPMPVQYPPMPMQYPPPYGYPMPMPARPMYYQPPPMMQQQAPMYQGQGGGNTKVFVYGPLLDEGVVIPANPMADPPKSLPIRKSDPALPTVNQAQAPVPGQPTSLSRGGYQTLPTYSKADLVPEACGPGCEDGSSCGASCRPSCGPQVYEPPMRGRGHFIGEVAASFLMPIFNTRIAYNTTAGGATTTTDFNHILDVGASGYVGYVGHTGWGVRAGFFHINGATSVNVSNADPTVTIPTPTGPLGIVSPSPALLNGIGVDQFKFTQRIAADIADLEVVKEASCLDSTFLFTFGGRYARFVQSYSATRTNPGGSNGGVTTAVDREDLDVSSYFQGWGPTASVDFVHPLGRCGLSVYGTVRGSFLWGTDRFAQNSHLTNTTVPAGGAAVFTDTANSVASYETRYVTGVEAEGGLQYGCRVGCCYVFMRAGATYQRWWDVGNPSTSSGSLSFIGGTARLGISY
jgi:Legionella pneumophila major outer membrane protein precursor